MNRIFISDTGHPEKVARLFPFAHVFPRIEWNLKVFAAGVKVGQVGGCAVQPFRSNEIVTECEFKLISGSFAIHEAVRCFLHEVTSFTFRLYQRCASVRFARGRHQTVDDCR